MVKKLLLFCLLLAFGKGIKAQVIYNAYANVTNISGSTFTVNNVNETNHTFTVGQAVVIIQMQDNVIGTNTTNASTFGDLGIIQSAGLYEIQIVSAVTRPSGTLTTVTFSSSLLNTYHINSNASVQMVTLRRLSSAAFTTTNNITGAAWNGTVGGVIAIEVGTDLTLAHNISADYLGFRGGAASTSFSGAVCTAASETVYIVNDPQYGSKGEGIYKNTSSTFTYARGKILNGGGGGDHHNGGGGGGSNYTAGGVGGVGYSNCTTYTAGGLGGIAMSSFSGGRLFLGGAGGGGQQNDNQGSAGGRGGGIILIKASRLITTGSCGSPRTITANGESATDSGQDGAGGGGAGGSIMFQVNTFSVVSTCSLNIRSNGGNGATVNHVDTHGAGGPGGQGYVVFSTPQPTTNVLVTVNNGTAGCNNNSSPCNSFAGNASGSNNQGIIPNTNGVSCTNVNLLYNYDFESPVQTSIGNNIQVGQSVWGGWTITPTADFNVILANGSSYNGGPNNAQTGSQYIDVTNAAGDLRQGFRVACTSTVTFSGYFSSREAGGYTNWTGSIQLINSSGSVVATSTTRNFTSADGSEDQIWYQLTGTATLAAGDYTYSAVLGNYGNFDNAFLCGSTCFLLPIELVYFNAAYNDEAVQVDLSWQTASEKNNDYFTVERSMDGNSWLPIRRVPGAGTTKQKRNYACSDPGRPLGITYYRLRQTDYDGAVKYSSLATVDPNDKGADLQVFPNPAQGLINVKSNSVIRSLTLINSLGQEVLSQSPELSSVTVELPNQGIYYLKVVLDTKTIVKKVINR